jgi:mannan endo-1,4-beta-mannosidase
LASTQRLGRHRHALPKKFGGPRRRQVKMVIAIAGAVAAIAILVSFAVYGPWQSAGSEHSPAQRQNLRAASISYIGLYARGVPDSYAPINAFTTATGINPSPVVYYSGWLEPFQSAFATTAASHGAVPMVQINPTGINLTAIADGHYDEYLSGYAKAVHRYGRPVIISFGHEMNGHWYSWAYRHTSPAVFVAAWRHIVDVFRALGARNVTWLWTVNTIQKQTRVPAPNRWWPGSSYVDWVGIDGYYIDSSSVFASVFGPTIAAVRQLTHDPILIAETSAIPSAGQPAKIADLFAGIHLYGLLGFVWFDTFSTMDFRLTSPAAIAAFRRGYEKYHGSA